MFHCIYNASRHNLCSPLQYLHMYRGVYNLFLNPQSRFCHSQWQGDLEKEAVDRGNYRIMQALNHGAGEGDYSSYSQNADFGKGEG